MGISSSSCRRGTISRLCGETTRRPPIPGAQGANVVKAFVVTNTNTNTFPTLSGSLPWAVGQANADTSQGAVSILIDPTLAGQTIHLNTTLTLSNTTANESIAIDAPSLGAGVTVSGVGNGSAFSVFAVGQGTTASLNGLIVTKGCNTFGGGIYNQGTLAIEGCTVTGNFAQDIFLPLGNEGEGAGIHNDGTMWICTSTISGNQADTEGGGIFNDGPLNVYNSFITGNTVEEGVGAGIYNGFGTQVTALISNTLISGNHFLVSNTVSNNQGGGIFNYGNLVVDNSTIQSNSATNGAGVYNASVATISTSAFNSNTASTNGGGVYNSGNATLVGDQFNNNVPSGSNGAIFNVGSITITGIIYGNPVPIPNAYTSNNWSGYVAESNFSCRRRIRCPPFMVRGSFPR